MTIIETLVDTMGMLVLSVGTLLIGCWRTRNETLDEPEILKKADETEALTVALLPCAASVLLISIYYFEITFWVVLVGYCCLAIAAAHFIVQPLEMEKGWIVSATTTALILLWLFTGNWLAHNTLTIIVAVFCMCAVKVPNAKVFTLLLIGLTCYDVFWVFLSPYFFGGSVMESVATRQRGYLSWPGTFLIPVTGGYSLLGAGDVVLPGVAITCLCRMDKDLNDWGRMEHPDLYARSSIIGYVVGFLICNLILDLTHTAQPALLYLTPSTLIPPLMIAYRRGELRGMWTGFRGDLEERSVLLA